MPEWRDEVSRRAFVREAAKFGAVAGAATAAVWTVPQLSSVALADDCGCSPEPPTTTSSASPSSVVPTSASPRVVRPGVRRAGSAAGAGAGGAGAGEGVLPFTGSDVLGLAKLGAASTALGAALVGISKLRHPFRRVSPEPSSPPGDATAS